MADINQTIVV